MDSAAPAPDSMREALATITRYSAELSQVLDDGKRKRRPSGLKRPGTPSLAGAHLPVFARNSSVSSMEIMGANSSRRSSFSIKPNKSTLSASSVDTAPTTVGSTFVPYYASPRNSVEPSSTKSHLPTSPASSFKHSASSRPPKPSSPNPLSSRSSPKSIPRSCISADMPSLPPARTDPRANSLPKHPPRYLRPGFASVPISPMSPEDCTARRLSSSPLVNGSHLSAKNNPPIANTKLPDVIITRPDVTKNSQRNAMPEAASDSKSSATIISQPDATIISPPNANIISKPRASSQTPFPTSNRPLSPAATSDAAVDKLISPKSSGNSANSLSRSRRSEGRIRRRDCYRRIVKQHLNDSTACYVSGAPVVSQFDIDDHVITFDDYKWAAPVWQAYCMTEKEGRQLKNPDGASSSKAGQSSAGPSTLPRLLNSGSTPPLADPFVSPNIPAFIAAALTDVPLGPTAPSSATHEANLVEAALAFQRSKSAKVTDTAPLSLPEEAFAPRRASASAVGSSSARPLRSTGASSSAHQTLSVGPSSYARSSVSVAVPSAARPPRSPEPSSLHLFSSGFASSSDRPVISEDAVSSARPPISRSTSSPKRPPSFVVSPFTAKPPRSPELSHLRRSSSDSPSPVRAPPSGFASRSKPLVHEPERLVPAPSTEKNDHTPSNHEEIVPEGFFDVSPRLRKQSKRINSAQLPPLPPRDQQRRQHSSRVPAKRPISKGQIDLEPEEPRTMPSMRESPRNMRMKSNRLSKLIFSGLKSDGRESSKRSEDITSERQVPHSNNKRRNPVRSATVGPGRTSIGARFRGGRPEKSSTTRSKVVQGKERDEARGRRDRDEDAAQVEGGKPIRQQSYCKTGSVPGLRRTRFMRLIGSELVCYSRDLNRELWKSQVKNAFVKLHEAHRKISVYTLVARRPIVFYLASSDMLASWSRALAGASATSPPRKYTSQKTAKELQREGVYF